MFGLRGDIYGARMRAAQLCVISSGYALCLLSYDQNLLSATRTKCTADSREHSPPTIEPALRFSEGIPEDDHYSFILKCALTQATLSITSHHERRLHRHRLANSSSVDIARAIQVSPAWARVSPTITIVTHQLPCEVSVVLCFAYFIKPVLYNILLHFSSSVN